ncbi:hypothetical protein G6011_05955 [Alternaria panax]|uniref:Uncharacterized protein n=1 Tax=Alternaria panax TaxID=48097 RepID=A0AAD4I7S6_9PLEO|nr:hypothetical protein G6011_05955 [Alternaria panax]
MSNIAMASCPNTPTARKASLTLRTQGPGTSSPSSKGAAKSQQQRKGSISQVTMKAQQQRKNSNPQASPKVVGQQRRQSTATADSTLAGNKRKIKEEEQPSRKENLQVNADGAEKRAAQPDSKPEPPPKKQKISSVDTDLVPSHTTTAPLPANPELPPNFQITQLLRHVLQTHPSLCPSSPSFHITSSNIDAITHTMWQVAFHHGPMLASACRYSAIFSPLKLAALAKLNFLPSWWFLRDCAVRGLPEVVGELWVIDDGEMQSAWKEAVVWCVGVLDSVNVKGAVGEVGKGNMQEGGEGEKMKQ